jgi:hypothetical protein
MADADRRAARLHRVRGHARARLAQPLSAREEFVGAAARLLRTSSAEIDGDIDGWLPYLGDAARRLPSHQTGELRRAAARYLWDGAR